MELAYPCTGLGNCDSRVLVLEALLLLLLQQLQEFVDGLLHLLPIRSGIQAVTIKLGGRRAALRSLGLGGRGRDRGLQRQRGRGGRDREREKEKEGGLVRKRGGGGERKRAKERESGAARTGRG